MPSRPADVTPLPKWIEHGEPGGVNWTPRHASPTTKSASSRQPKLFVEALGAIDVRNRDDDDLELHVEPPRGCDLSFEPCVECAMAISLFLMEPRDQCAARSDLNAARSSAAKSSGCSHAAKWPPLSTSWK